MLKKSAQICEVILRRVGAHCGRVGPMTQDLSGTPARWCRVSQDWSVWENLGAYAQRHSVPKEQRWPNRPAKR